MAAPPDPPERGPEPRTVGPGLGSKRRAPTTQPGNGSAAPALRQVRAAVAGEIDLARRGAGEHQVRVVADGWPARARRRRRSAADRQLGGRRGRRRPARPRRRGRRAQGAAPAPQDRPAVTRVCSSFASVRYRSFCIRSSAYLCRNDLRQDRDGDLARAVAADRQADGRAQLGAATGRRRGAATSSRTRAILRRLPISPR